MDLVSRAPRPRGRGRPLFAEIQRWRDDNKNKICMGVGRGGRERRIAQNAVFLGKRYDNKSLKVQILLSSNFVVIAQAPTNAGGGTSEMGGGAGRERKGSG